MPEPPSPVPVQINLAVPEAVRLGVYSDYLRVSHTEHSFVLDFAQLPPPVDLPASAPDVPPPSVEAPVVARVVVPRDLLPRIIMALQQNWQLRETRGAQQPNP